MTDTHGLRSPRVRRLRDLARDRRTRDDQRRCLVEGPRVVDAALDRGAVLEEVWFGEGARRAFPDLVARLDAAGIEQLELREGVLEKVGSTRTPQPVLGVAAWSPAPVADVVGDGLVLVADALADPGNVGTILRSAEAAGCDGVILTGPGVDPRSPKVVRASAGALFGVPVAVTPDLAAATRTLSEQGVRRLAAVARGGVAPDAVDLAHRVAVVVGNEAHGLDDAVVAGLDGTVTIPMAGATESLNAAMAATVLCFESARQRAGRSQ